MRKIAMVLGVGIVGIFSNLPVAHASSLGLSSGNKDVTVNFVIGGVSYNASSHAFTATGSTIAYTPITGGTSTNLTAAHRGTFTLDATISNTGIATVADLTVTADLNNDNIAETVYHSTTLSNFAYSAPDKFEFIYTSDGTGLAPVGQKLGVIVGNSSFINSFSSTTPVAYTPSFGANFSSSGLGSADVYAIPEPATLSLAAVGMGALLLRRRSRA